MKDSDFGCNTTFLDLLFNMLLAFTALFVLAFSMMNQNKSDKNATAKAEFIITVTWPPEMDDDVDTYVEDPDGAIVFFRRREDGLMHLDRDDLGKRGDYLQTKLGPVAYDENREIVTLRGTSPGEYIVNVHMYHRNQGDTGPCEVTVQIDKLNPFSTVMKKTVTLQKSSEEKTVVRFVLDDKANVTSMNELEKLYVGEAHHRENSRPYMGIPRPHADPGPPDVPNPFSDLPGANNGP